LSQSENQIAQAEAEYEAEQQNFFIRTAKAYFGVLAAQSNLQFASAEKQSLEFQLKQAKKRFEVGTASITDIREAQAGFDQSKASEIDAEKKLREAKSILTEIIGLFDVELNPLRDDVPLELPIPSNLDDWIGLARQNNWTIIAASNRAEALRKNVEIQFSGHLPTLDFVGNFGVSDTDRPAGMVSNSQTIGLQLNVPIFQGGGVESRIRQAEHQLAGAKQNVDKQRRAAERQAQDAYQGIELSISQIEVLKSAVESTKVALNAAEKGLSVGTRTMADVLTVTRNLSRAQRDHAQARYDYILSGLTLKQATGSISRTDLEVVNKWLH
jgi:outer membrane protein